MSDVDIGAETVERLARELRRSIGQHEDVRCDAAATLRALRAALDAAEMERDATEEQASELRAEIRRNERDVRVAIETSASATMQLVKARDERDAALAARDAAWRAGRDAAAGVANAELVAAMEVLRDAMLSRETRRDAMMVRNTARDIEKVVRALQPPADLAAEAPGDAVAKEREACAKIAEWGHMVPPDGGSPTEAEYEVARNIAALIRARAGA